MQHIDRTRRPQRRRSLPTCTHRDPRRTCRTRPRRAGGRRDVCLKRRTRRAAGGRATQAHPHRGPMSSPARGVDPGDRRSAAATSGEADRRGRTSKFVEGVEKRRDVALRPERLGRPEKTEKTAMENGNRRFHKSLRELLCGMQGGMRSRQGISPTGRRRRRTRARRDESREDRRRTPVHHAMLEPRVQGDSVYTGRGKERFERRQGIRFSGSERATADRLIGGRERLGERAERCRRLLRRCL